MFSDPAHTHIFLDPTYLITPLELNPILYAWLTTGGASPGPFRPGRELQPQEQQERKHEQNHEHRGQSDHVADRRRGAGDPRGMVETGGKVHRFTPVVVAHE